MPREYKCSDCASYVLDPDNHCSNPDPCVSYSRFKLAPKKPKYTVKEARKLATLIHSYQCSFNHVDQCSWFYEKWNGKGVTRLEYLKTAEQLLNKHSMNTVVDIIETLSENA